MKEDLLKMADRVEALSGPDREVDERISLAIGLPATVTIGHEVLGNLRQVPHTIKRYTASRDAAMTLVPAGWWVVAGGAIRWRNWVFMGLLGLMGLITRSQAPLGTEVWPFTRFSFHFLTPPIFLLSICGVFSYSCI